MEQFSIVRNNAEKFGIIEKLIKEGIGYGLDLQEVVDKLESVKLLVGDGIIRIALLGSFSDGKTSAIAGLLGRLEDSMKIDQDESSDELKVYRPAGLKEGFEIVDTPGLFGTKEKEVDGKNIKYSDITKKYLSEAHIVIYVCDAVTPLKDSHAPIIKWIMRDLGKLNSSIFVINKMDEAGYDLLDDSDYMRGNEIKRNALIARLRNVINLTPEEENKLNIVCIAADPKGKGLAHWFNKPESYIRRSHIDELRNKLKQVVENSNTEELGKSTVYASLLDMVTNVGEEIDNACLPVRASLKVVDESCKDLSFDVQQLKTELVINRNEMENQLQQYKNSIKNGLSAASVETISGFIDNELGVQNGNVTFYVFQRNVDRIISSCSESNETVIHSSLVKFEHEFDAQNQFLTEALKDGASYLKTITVTGEQVKSIRNIIAKGYKFKPHGAKNLGKNITKGIGYAAAGISLALDAYSFYQRYKADKNTKKMKIDLENIVDEFFSKVFASFSGDSYYTNFAPSFIEMQNRLQERNDEVERLRSKISDLEAFKAKIDQWKKGEYVEFEKV